MTQITDTLRDSKRLRLIATALELMQYERTDSAVIPIPGTEPQRYVVVGSAATVARLLEIAPAAPVAKAVPEGCALVPIKPTQKMLLAGFDAIRGTPKHQTRRMSMRDAYAAMLAAAPQAPTTQEVTQQAAPDMRDAYVGAREDLAIWRKRALEAEESCRRLAAALNAENGPTFMGEPVITQQAAKAEPVGVVGTMPGTDGFTMACFKASEVPVGTELFLAPTASTASAPEEVRNQTLEEAAEKLDAMNDSSGDAAAYDQREQNIYELEREHAISDCAKAIRALRTTTDKGEAA